MIQSIKNAWIRFVAWFKGEEAYVEEKVKGEAKVLESEYDAYRAKSNTAVANTSANTVA